MPTEIFTSRAYLHLPDKGREALLGRERMINGRNAEAERKGRRVRTPLNFWFQNGLEDHHPEIINRVAKSKMIRNPRRWLAFGPDVTSKFPEITEEANRLLSEKKRNMERGKG